MVIRLRLFLTMGENAVFGEISFSMAVFDKFGI